MSPKPSKSEIETALSGRTKRRPAAARPPVPTEFQLESAPRRQQVIGGDLTGVSKRSKTGIFSRYSEISIANWIAAGLVLLILVAFFWPQSSDSIREVASQAETIDSESIYTESRLDETPEEPVASKTFSRETDIDRATNFREQDALESNVRQLLADAEQHLQQGRYIEPADNSALQVFNSIIEIDPGNVAARQGIDKINQRFLNAGLGALSKGNPSLANDALASLGSINEKSDEYQELSVGIERWKIKKQITRLLANAQKAVDANALILPARENALYFYQQVQILDARNKAARRGIKKITDTYILRASDAVLAGQYQAAAAHLATVSVIDPKHASIPLIEAMINKAKPLAENAPRNTPQTPPEANAQTTPETQNTNQASPPAQNETARIDPPPTKLPSTSGRTPAREANEQALFDRKYLEQGLESYYKGDYETAAALLQPLADKGISRAQFRLAYMYYLGRGFKRDRKEADRIIRAALPAIKKFAEEGRGWAQSDLGSLYEDGLVLPRDFAEAVYWYRSAAEQDYPGAQTNLGIMYARGRGVTSSRRTAIEWFQRAAKQGDIVAKRNLEAMGIK